MAITSNVKQTIALTADGQAQKYVAGTKSPSAREREIKRTRALYKAGKLTPAMMDKISKSRAKDRRKKRA